MPKCSYYHTILFHLTTAKLKRKWPYIVLDLKQICFIYFHTQKNQQINIKLNNRSYIKTDIYRSKKNLFKKNFNKNIEVEITGLLSVQTQHFYYKHLFYHVKRIKLLCYRLLHKYFFLSFLNCKYIYSTHN